jgi:hypothetical protein
MVPAGLATQVDNPAATASTAAAGMNDAGPGTKQIGTAGWRVGCRGNVLADLRSAAGDHAPTHRGTNDGRAVSTANHETGANSSAADFRRLDHLTYDRVEGRWKYVSMDTRLPVNIMPAWSFRGEQEGKITLQFGVRTRSPRSPDEIRPRDHAEDAGQVSRGSISSSPTVPA